MQLTCLALAAYMEARQHYQTHDAMSAVVEVVLNRAEDTRWPNTPCGVIADPGQFPWFTGVSVPKTDGVPDKWAWDAALGAAAQGRTLGLTSTHFHTKGHRLDWADHYDADGCIGGNCFYTNNTEYR